VFDFASVDYATSYHWQLGLVTRAAQEKRLSQIRRTQSDTILLLEHPPVYTLGKAADLDHVGFDPVQPPPGV